jgi:hypothetical protein
MEKATQKSSESQGRKKSSEATTSASNNQAKWKIKKEVLTSDSDETYFDYAEFLKTYDPEKEYSDSSDSSSEDHKESLKNKESKKEDSEATKDDVKSKYIVLMILYNKNFAIFNKKSCFHFNLL